MMTEQKRVSLISVGLPKKEKKTKTDELSTRLDLSIAPNNGEEFATFNYQALISKAKTRKDGKVNGVGPLDPYADDDEDQLKTLARNLEAKYGTPEKKKYGCFVNYNKLGEGYDENDSFIDNSEAFDEVVPDNQTTAYGGFYINVGPLEMKTVPGVAADEQSDSDGNVGGGRKGTKRRLESESEEESDDDDDDDDDSSSTNSMEDNAGQSESEESLEEDGEEGKAANGEANGQVVKKAKVQNESKESAQGPPLKKKKNKNGAMEKKGSDNETSTAKRDDSSTGGESRRPSTNSEVVDSAGGDDRQNDDTGSSASKSISGSGESSDTECSEEASDTPKPEVPSLPPENPNLPEDIRDLFRLIHNIVSTNSAAKGKAFCPEVNKHLLRFEMKCQDLPQPLHNEAYNQLSMIMSCSPKKLARKSSEILKSHIESSISTKIQSLKIAVDNQMPTCLDRYNRECERLAASERNQDDKAKKPRRRFRWTPEMRGMVYELTNLRRTLFKLQASDGGSEDDDVRSFLTQHVCPLWPSGWMKVVALMDIRPAQNSESPAVAGSTPAASKPKKSLPLPRKSLPKVANVPTTPLNPVPVPPSITQMSVPMSSPGRTEHLPPVNIIKKPSPPKTPVPTSLPSSLPSSIAKISVPQGTDITPVNLSSSKLSSVNGSNRPTQITVKPVFNPNPLCPREDASQSGQKQSKAKAQVSSDVVSSRTLLLKPGDVHQELEKVPGSELEILPSASDSSLSLDRLRVPPSSSQMNRLASPDKHLSTWKNRPTESQDTLQWKVKDEPSAVHEKLSPLEDEILILEDFSSPPSNYKKPVVIEVTSHRPKLGGGGDPSSQATEQNPLDRVLGTNVQSLTNGNQGGDEMTITVSPIESQDQQGNARGEDRLRNTLEEQTSQDYRMNVQDLLNFTDLLEAERVQQTSHVSQLKTAGSATLRAD